MGDIGGFSYNPPDGPTQLEIELLPLGGKAIEPVVYVSGVLLVSHDFNTQRPYEFQHNVLEMPEALEKRFAQHSPPPCPPAPRLKSGRTRPLLWPHTLL